jgi:ketosteroid isomerase-like protein
MSVDISSDLAARIDRLESRDAIERLIAQYAHGFDARDVELIRSVFHDDALLALGEPFGDFEGIDAIAEAAHALWAQSPRMHHWMANAVVDVDGDVATGVAALDCLVINVDDGPTMVVGNYFDRYERRDGRWAIAERRFDLHFWAPLTAWKATLGSQA